MIWWIVGYAVIGILWAEFCFTIFRQLSEADRQGVSENAFYASNFFLWPLALLSVMFSKG